jgi:plastocyanin
VSLEARSGAAPDRADQGTRWMGDPWIEQRVPYTVVFNRAGTFPYFCTVHGGPLSSDP